MCGDGARQSPINIDTSLVVSNEDLTASPLIMNYHEVYHTEVQNVGSSIHVDIGVNNTLVGGPLPAGETIELTQIHFHAPGEHQINAMASDAEVHLVHKSTTSNFSAVLVVRVLSGAQNAWFDNIFTIRNLAPGTNTTLNINPLQLFPKSLLLNDYTMSHANYYYYIGSLTTPPCTEGVAWFVLIDPIFASASQITSLEQWEGINNRPIQPYNGTIYRPKLVETPSGKEQELEDIRHMGMLIGVSFLVGLSSFFGILAIAIFALYVRDNRTKREFINSQNFEMSLRPPSPVPSPSLMSATTSRDVLLND